MSPNSGTGLVTERSRARRVTTVMTLALLCAAPGSQAEDIALDPATGLRITGDWQLVRNNCIACHSIKLVTQQRGSESQWLAVIRWMQDKQNLWQFDPDTESRIIGYLARNYPPQTDQRRAALEPQLMPPNPYSPGTGTPE